MSMSEFDVEFKKFEKKTIKRYVNRFWELFDKIDLDEDEAKEWCVTAQYGLNMRNIFEAIEDHDWKDIEEEISRLNNYA